ncbi:MAG: 16S rRNA (guanine(966)-N(2))-methyltransferase RsmD [Azoarcus sp.]|nr:16S rRNA (guanine(966)-N(2))-methyltransferase RsmD [Azoarcus sp.]
MNRVRIIGGTWRSRLLALPAGVAGLRPTPDRVRETLFNWLGQNLMGLACLDLFAGSGALGFEAASRGAASVTLVERDARACAALRRNAAALPAAQVEIVQGDAVDFLRSTRRLFDIAFVDPPYRQERIERIVALLDRSMRPAGRIYAEAEATLAEEAGWCVTRRGRAGQVHFHLMERAASDSCP